MSSQTEWLHVNCPPSSAIPLCKRVGEGVEWSGSFGYPGWKGGSVSPTQNFHINFLEFLWRNWLAWWFPHLKLPCFGKKKKSSILSGSAHVEWPQTPADSKFLIPFTSASLEQNFSWDFPQNPASKIALGFFWLTNWPDLITEQWSQETWGMCGIGCGIYGTFFGMTRIKAIPLS